MWVLGHKELKTTMKYLNFDFEYIKKNLTSPMLPNISIDSRGKQPGDIAQLGERLNGIQEVSGSIPLISTI